MRAFSADARLGRWMVQQRERARHKADRVVARYQRRMGEHASTQDLRRVETRGIAQPCDMEYRRRYKGVVGDFDF